MQPEVDLLVIGNLVMHDHSDLASRLDELEQRYEKIQIWQNIGVDPTGTLNVAKTGGGYVSDSLYTIDTDEWPGNIDAIAVLHNVVPEDSPCVNAAGRTLAVTLSGTDNRTYTLVDPLGVDNVPSADSDVVFFIITQTQHANLIDTDYILDRWQIIIGGGTGDVVGPAGAIADNIAVFNGVTGKLIKDGGQKIADLVPSSDTTATPAASKIPISRPGGTINPAWLPSVVMKPTATDTSGANLTNIANSPISLKAGVRYNIKGHIQISSGGTATSGVKFALNVSNAATFYIGMFGAAGTGTNLIYDYIDTNDTINATLAFHTQASRLRTVTFNGTITVGGSDITATLRFQSGNAAQVYSVVADGSCIEFSEI